MKIGTKSVLFGAHCFLLHPFFVAAAWWKLYGFPWDPRLWVAFIVHDLGYLGKPNMDGTEGEKHPEFGAWIMSVLFDGRESFQDCAPILLARHGGKTRWIGKWGQLCLFHSRYYSRRANAKYSQLCYADKLSFSLTPRWLYLPMVTATGEIREYLREAQRADSSHWTPAGFDKVKWHAQLKSYMEKWVEEHKDGSIDTWTSGNRNATPDILSGAELIAAERERQISDEGWTLQHDAQHARGDLAFAGLCYIRAGIERMCGVDLESIAAHVPFDWPWESCWWKPSPEPFRNMVKGAALVAAEIDRSRQLKAS